MVILEIFKCPSSFTKRAFLGPNGPPLSKKKYLTTSLFLVHSLGTPLIPPSNMQSIERQRFDCQVFECQLGVLAACALTLNVNCNVLVLPMLLLNCWFPLLLLRGFLLTHYMSIAVRQLAYGDLRVGTSAGACARSLPTTGGPCIS